MRDAAGCLMLDPRFNLVSRIHNKVSAMTLVERAESWRVRYEVVVPATMVMSKGLIHRYVPLAITLIYEKVFLRSKPYAVRFPSPVGAPNLP